MNLIALKHIDLAIDHLLFFEQCTLAEVKEALEYELERVNKTDWSYKEK